MQAADQFPGALDFPVHVILEIARQVLNLLDLLLQVVAEAHELVDDLALHLGGLVGFEIALPVKVAQDLGRIGEPPGFEEGGGHEGVVDDVGRGEEQFGAHLVGLLDFFKEDDEVFDDLAPCYTDQTPIITGETERTHLESEQPGPL